MTKLKSFFQDEIKIVKLLHQLSALASCTAGDRPDLLDSSVHTNARHRSGCRRPGVKERCSDVLVPGPSSPGPLDVPSALTAPAVTSDLLEMCGSQLKKSKGKKHVSFLSRWDMQNFGDVITDLKIIKFPGHAKSVPQMRFQRKSCV